MISNRQERLFAALRRDSVLFALVGALVLFLHALQPLAQASALGGGHGEVICTLLGASPGETAPAGDDCPQCVAGPCAGFAFATPVRDSEHAAFAGLAVSTRSTFPERANEGAPRRPGDPPPASRAPPLSA